MKKQMDFSYYLSEYLTKHLAGQRNLSENTIMSYRDTFCLLLTFMDGTRNCPPERVTLKKLDSDTVEAFLSWLQNERGNSISTQNQRLAAIHAFFRFVQIKKPELILQCQQILSIHAKEYEKTIVSFLSENTLRDLLSKPDRSNRAGRRDAALLCVLYDTGARVQELIDLSVRDVRLLKPATIRLTGKGRKSRVVPVMSETAAILKDYMLEQGLDTNLSPNRALFFNRQGNRLTRPGVTYILNKYMQEADADGLTNEGSITPHILRHTKAMHMLRANVNIMYIRDFLGHVDIDTTEVYAVADAEMKRRAFEKNRPDVIPTSETSWQKNSDLMTWLTGLGRD